MYFFHNIILFVVYLLGFWFTPDIVSQMAVGYYASGAVAPLVDLGWVYVLFVVFIYSYLFFLHFFLVVLVS
jgi:hypothetical protein